MSKSQKPSPDTQTNQDADKDLRELLTEVGEQAALRSAKKRRAIEETLLQPDMLSEVFGTQFEWVTRRDGSRWLVKGSGAA